MIRENKFEKNVSNVKEDREWEFEKDRKGKKKMREWENCGECNKNGRRWKEFEF